MPCFLVADVLLDAVERRGGLVVPDRTLFQVPGEQLGRSKIRAFVRRRPADQDDAVVPQQADAAVGAELEHPVELIEVVAVDRGGEDAGETAVLPVDPLRQDDGGSSGQARLQGLIDAERISRCLPVIGEVGPVGIVVQGRLRQRRIQPLAIGIEHADLAQLRQRVDRIHQIAVEPRRDRLAILQQFDHSGHRDIGRLDGMGRMFGQRVREVHCVGLAARKRGSLGVERLPGHDAQHAGRHDQRKDDHHHRRRYAAERPVGFSKLSIGHGSP